MKALDARSIGPAVMGGRVSDIAFDPEDPATFYVAVANGGLQKTTDNGGSFSGLMDREAALPVAEDTSFHWASMTKTFTAIAVMQLRDRGLLALDDPAVKYLRPSRI